jgi:hypothetical protein
MSGPALDHGSTTTSGEELRLAREAVALFVKVFAVEV